MHLELPSLYLAVVFYQDEKKHLNYISNNNNKFLVYCCSLGSCFKNKTVIPNIKYALFKHGYQRQPFLWSLYFTSASKKKKKTSGIPEWILRKFKLMVMTFSYGQKAISLE